MPYDATGVSAADSVFRVSVSADAHALDAVSVMFPLNVPAVAADHSEMLVIVSDVPPFVHGPAVPVIAFDPADAAAITG